MSSLAAARADNFYYDPARFDPKKRGRDSANALAGSHPLGVRAKRLGEGILVIRFEMPFDTWCLGCGMHIARGVRFNADKKKKGMYYSTPVWEFSMKCTSCSNVLVIASNPKDATYDCVSGLRVKVKSFSAEEAGTIELRSEAEREAMRRDAFAVLENAGEDKRKAAAAAARLEAMMKQQEVRWGDDYANNKGLRAVARAERTARASELAAGRARSLDMPLLPISEHDTALARMVMLERDVGGGVAAAGGMALLDDGTAVATAAAADAGIVPPLSSSFVPARKRRRSPSPESSAADASSSRGRSTSGASTGATSVHSRAARELRVHQAMLRKRAHTAVGAQRLVLIKDDPPPLPPPSAPPLQRVASAAPAPAAPTAVGRRSTSTAAAARSGMVASRSVSSSASAGPATQQARRAAVTGMLDGSWS